jgi:hypothetical protein
VTFGATPKASQKTSKTVELFDSEARKAAVNRGPADPLMQPQAHVIGVVEIQVFLDLRTVADSDFKS